MIYSTWRQRANWAKNNSRNGSQATHTATKARRLRRQHRQRDEDGKEDGGEAANAVEAIRQRHRDRDQDPRRQSGAERARRRQCERDRTGRSNRYDAPISARVGANSLMQSATPLHAKIGGSKK